MNINYKKKISNFESKNISSDSNNENIVSLIPNIDDHFYVSTANVGASTRRMSQNTESTFSEFDNSDNE